MAKALRDEVDLTWSEEDAGDSDMEDNIRSNHPAQAADIREEGKDETDDDLQIPDTDDDDDAEAGDHLPDVVQQSSSTDAAQIIPLRLPQCAST